MGILAPVAGAVGGLPLGLAAMLGRGKKSGKRTRPEGITLPPAPSLDPMVGGGVQPPAAPVLDPAQQAGWEGQPTYDPMVMQDMSLQDLAATLMGGAMPQGQASFAPQGESAGSGIGGILGMLQRRRGQQGGMGGWMRRQRY